MDRAHKGPERRRFKRLKVNFILTYQIDRPVHVVMLIGGKEIEAMMCDLSQIGMAILTSYNIPVSTILLIKFTLVNPYAPSIDRIKSIKMLAEVRSNILLKGGERRLGISFSRISKEDAFAITEFLRKKLD